MGEKVNDTLDYTPSRFFTRRLIRPKYIARRGGTDTAGSPFLIAPLPAALRKRGLAVDPVILGELRFGILLLTARAKRRRLESWFDSGVSRLRCVPWEAAMGLRWAQLLADLRRAGRAMPLKDSLDCRDGVDLWPHSGHAQRVGLRPRGRGVGQPIRGVRMRG